MPTNLDNVRADLSALWDECDELGVSKNIRDRIEAVRLVLEVIERARQKQGLA